MDSDELDRGDILLSRPVSKAKKVVAKVNVSGFITEKMEKESRYSLVSNFSYVVAVVEEVGEEVRFSLEKPVALLPGDKLLLIRDRSPRIFASGTVISTE